MINQCKRPRHKRLVTVLRSDGSSVSWTPGTLFPCLAIWPASFEVGAVACFVDCSCETEAFPPLHSHHPHCRCHYRTRLDIFFYTRNGNGLCDKEGHYHVTSHRQPAMRVQQHTIFPLREFVDINFPFPQGCFCRYQTSEQCNTWGNKMCLPSLWSLGSNHQTLSSSQCSAATLEPRSLGSLVATIKPSS